MTRALQIVSNECVFLNLTENHSKFLDRAVQSISRLSARCKQQLCVRLTMKTRSHKRQTEIIFRAAASFYVVHGDQGVMCACLCRATSLMRPRTVRSWRGLACIIFSSAIYSDFRGTRLQSHCKKLQMTKCKSKIDLKCHTARLNCSEFATGHTSHVVAFCDAALHSHAKRQI